ncbi:porin [Cupriavidus basilensis]
MAGRESFISRKTQGGEQCSGIHRRYRSAGAGRPRPRLAPTPLALAACVVDAQTSVTLYGVLDSNVEYVTNMSTVTPSAANGLALGTGKDLARMTSFGLRGTENLGPGLKALLVLESGFGVDDGRSQQGGRPSYAEVPNKSPRVDNRCNTRALSSHSW